MVLTYNPKVIKGLIKTKVTIHRQESRRVGAARLATLREYRRRFQEPRTKNQSL